MLFNIRLDNEYKGLKRMDLIGGYLLVMLIFFSGNISLLLGNYRISNLKLILFSAIAFIISFGLMFASGYVNIDLLEYLSYLFLIAFVLLFLIMFLYVKKNNLKLSLISVSILAAITIMILSSQSNLGILDILLYSLFTFIIFFVTYQLSKLLQHAKRRYSVIVGEFMSLFSVLVFIFTLTYNSTRALKYTMFRPFLILTPTHQLIYVVIAIVVILIVGVFLNDSKGGNS